MKRLPTIILCLTAVISAIATPTPKPMPTATRTSATEATFNEILGREKVTRIVDDASKSIAEAPRAEQTPKTVVQPELQEEIIQRAGESKLTIEDPANRVAFAARRLREGVTKFFRDYRDFVIRVREVHDAVVTLTTKELGRFFDSVNAAKQCGKLPCDIPPCCGNCDGCEPKQ